MRKRDLLSVCIDNLKRRKSRTFLTVLGVIIGCCAIVIMISIGIGTQEAQDLMLSQMGDLTIVTVYTQSRDASAAKLDDSAVKSFERIPHVEAVSPKQFSYDLTMRVYAGKDKRYVSNWADIMGIESSTYEKFGFKLIEGDYTGRKPYSVLVGKNFAYGFADQRRPEGRNMIEYYMYQEDDPEMPEPYFDPLTTPLELEIVVSEEGGSEKTFTQEIYATGRTEEDYSKGYQTGEGIIMDIHELQTLIDTAKKEQGQKPDTKKTYENVMVKAADMEYVEEIEEQIQAMGYSTDSMESIRKPMQEEARQRQLMLGGIGAISLFVAALGIMNTMIMSISERTREIGIMKALGCFVSDIRAIFLLEAGCIGFIGGAVGVILSLIISTVMNLAAYQAPITGIGDVIAALTAQGTRISVIPLWLIGFAMLFSVVIGVASGYYPANKAVKISALEAIKRE
ncbi:MAG: ABC transporter permease [Clostridia bacterium]|nr:ABC transporter permease [Clostridia bacterium]MBQ4248871.1 ABC transporter permease [Clostridia bacterium]